MVELEALGRAAKDGIISWRQAAKDGGLTHHQGLKNHMERHWNSPVDKIIASLDDELTVELAKVETELLEKLRMSPTEVKPLYATAIRNLRGLMETKPSQQHLIAALKGIHEITGMRMEQQMLLSFGQRMFGSVPEPVAELEDRNHIVVNAVFEVEDAELVD
jgi:hypothetical protein